MKKPEYAASIWCHGDHIYAELSDGERSHTVRVPNDEVGIKKILILARSRHNGSKIGTKGDPTQTQINKPTYDPRLVRRVGREKVVSTAEQRASAREILRKMGMI